MKRSVILLVCIAMLLCMVGCNSNENAAGTNGKQNPVSTLKSLKILAIGNSFSVDAMEYLYDVAKAEGVEEIVLGNLYIGGCTLSMHADNTSSETGNYRYYKNTDGAWTQTEGYTILQGLQDESWDIITMQQGSASSGIVDTYNASLDTLVSYVEMNKTNPDAKIYWHMTWAYQANSTHDAFPQYGNSQQAMYSSIVYSVQQKITTNDAFAGILPVGTAIQNARAGEFGDTLTRDGHHLNDLGRVIAAYTWYAALNGQKLQTLRLTEVNEKLTLSDADKKLIVSAVNAAISQPFAITK